MKKGILILFVLLTLLPRSVLAESIKGEAPKPSFVLSALGSDSSSMFVDSAKVGDKLTYKVDVKNVSNKKSSFKIYATDVVPAIRGGWSYPASFDKKTLVGTWFKEKVVEDTLNSNKSKNYEFNLTVPKDLKDGQYIGAIVVEEFIPATTDKTTGSMSAVSDMYMRIFVQTVINVNPDSSLHEVEIKDIYHEVGSNGLISIYIPHINKGTILEKPAGKLSLKNSSAELIKEEDYSMDSVYVGTTGLYDMNMSDILKPDTYTLSYTSKYIDKVLTGEYKFKVTQKEVVSALDKADNTGQRYKSGLLDFLYMYWVWILITVIFIILLIVIIILLLLRMRKEKKKSDTTLQQGEESTHVKENENTASL